MPLKDQLKAILSRHEGRSQAITSRELSGVTGQPDRTIRLAIRELRREKFPILSSTEFPAGYYLPNNRGELGECLSSLRSRLIEDAKTRRDIKVGGDCYLTPAEQLKLC